MDLVPYKYCSVCIGGRCRVREIWRRPLAIVLQFLSSRTEVAHWQGSAVQTLPVGPSKKAANDCYQAHDVPIDSRHLQYTVASDLEGIFARLPPGFSGDLIAVVAGKMEQLGSMGVSSCSGAYSCLRSDIGRFCSF